MWWRKRSAPTFLDTPRVHSSPPLWGRFLALFYFCFPDHPPKTGRGNHILSCGDVESNPGPPTTKTILNPKSKLIRRTMPRSRSLSTNDPSSSTRIGPLHITTPLPIPLSSSPEDSPVPSPRSPMDLSGDEGQPLSQEVIPETQLSPLPPSDAPLPAIAPPPPFLPITPFFFASE